ncbi:MAG: type II secretion system protein, partial [Phycisphaerales bacterium]
GTRRPRRGGFSVLELTIAIAILGVMMGVAGFAFVKFLAGARVSATETTMRNVDANLTAYLAAKGSYPATLRELVPNYMDQYPVDGWDREFFYSTQGQSFILISWGADGEDGTDDDINYFQDVKNTGNTN